MVVAVALIGLLQVGPVILSSGAIGDNYYDAPRPWSLSRRPGSVCSY